MASNTLTATLSEMEELAKIHEHVVVAYSGGKDSSIVLDIAVRFFKKVSAFKMVFLPGMPLELANVAKAKQLWGVEPVEYIHWVTTTYIAGEILRPHWADANGEFPQYKLGDLYALSLAESGATLLLSGVRANDGPGAQRLLKRKTRTPICYPLRAWNKYDVLAYTKARNIPIQEGDEIGKTSFGIGLRADCLLWLHDEHPIDYAVIKQAFPFADAVIWRRAFYGDEKTKATCESGDPRHPVSEISGARKIRRGRDSPE